MKPLHPSSQGAHQVAAGASGDPDGAYSPSMRSSGFLGRNYKQRIMEQQVRKSRRRIVMWRTLTPVSRYVR